jgi:hypothetical protein
LVVGAVGIGAGGAAPDARAPCGIGDHHPLTKQLRGREDVRKRERGNKGVREGQGKKARKKVMGDRVTKSENTNRGREGEGENLCEEFDIWGLPTPTAGA